MGYAIVTPARDEAGNLGRLASSLAAQTLPPAWWIVVDDGSLDGTAELVRALAGRHPWVRLVVRSPAAGDLADGRRAGRALAAFRDGIAALPELPEVVVKADADTSYDPRYFERLVERFAADPRLGIAGGACYEREGGAWTRKRVVASHVRGASRAYRRECLDTVLGLEDRMGWDGLDEARAALRGYRTMTILELGFRHHRPTGGRERARLRHGTAQGRAAWYMGYRPSYILLRSLYRVWREPWAVSMPAGYLVAALARSPRCADASAVRHIRRGQRLRVVIARGSPP